MKHIMINDLPIVADYIEHSLIEKDGEELHQVVLEFKVTNENYHDVTVELYKNDFLIKLPEKQMTFSAVIQKYSTSITNLYKEDSVGEFKLLLIEKNK